MKLTQLRKKAGQYLFAFALGCFLLVGVGSLSPNAADSQEVVAQTEEGEEVAFSRPIKYVPFGNFWSG